MGFVFFKLYLVGPCVSDCTLWAAARSCFSRSAFPSSALSSRSPRVCVARVLNCLANKTREFGWYLKVDKHIDVCPTGAFEGRCCCIHAENRPIATWRTSEWRKIFCTHHSYGDHCMNEKRLKYHFCEIPRNHFFSWSFLVLSFLISYGHLFLIHSSSTIRRTIVNWKILLWTISS